MPNFFTDNEDILDYLGHADLRTLVTLQERGFADAGQYDYAPADYEDAIMRDGAHTAPSNAAFDATLRAENPEWGVRDVRDLCKIADEAGLSLAEITPMPANNLVLAFARTLRQN